MGQHESTLDQQDQSHNQHTHPHHHTQIGNQTYNPTAWPSWHQSLEPRGPQRGPSSRGIFRGEFILLRSSPPGSRPGKAKDKNGHLYAQRHRKLNFRCKKMDYTFFDWVDKGISCFAQSKDSESVGLDQ